MSEWADLVAEYASVLGTLVTAVATIFLWRVTKTLAVATNRMVEASSRPHVVATLAPNRWSMRHFDLHVDNTGNATAYDVRISFDPPLANGEARERLESVPFQFISVLRPGQGLSSYLTDYERIKGSKHVVTISWRRDPANSLREENEYTLDMADAQGVSRLGDDPLTQLADDLRKIREDWCQIASGSRRLEVNAYSVVDRLHEKRESQRYRRQWRQKHAKPDKPDKPEQA